MESNLYKILSGSLELNQTAAENLELNSDKALNGINSIPSGVRKWALEEDDEGSLRNLRKKVSGVVDYVNSESQPENGDMLISLREMAEGTQEEAEKYDLRDSFKNIYDKVSAQREAFNEILIGPCSGLELESEGDTPVLKWIDPDDYSFNGDILSEWTRTELYRKESMTAPSGPTDPDAVFLTETSIEGNPNRKKRLYDKRLCRHHCRPFQELFIQALQLPQGRQTEQL